MISPSSLTTAKSPAAKGGENKAVTIKSPGPIGTVVPSSGLVMLVVYFTAASDLVASGLGAGSFGGGSDRLVGPSSISRTRSERLSTGGLSLNTVLPFLSVYLKISARNGRILKHSNREDHNY